MTLSNEQQELLHAWVDGETTATEDQLVAQVVADPATSQDAKVYLHELKRVRELLVTHGGAHAPEGMRERILLALDEDETPIIRISWRTAILAVAAVVVVTLALVFEPLTTDTGAPAEVASTTPLDAGPHGGRGGAPRDQGTGAVEQNASPDGFRKAPPALPSDEREHSAPTVLRLDKGYDMPLEVSINMDRSRKASVLQVYNDMLVVGSLHGDARLLDEGASVGAWNDGDDFAGYDFSVYDGVEINVETARLPGLLSAINRMSNDQGYGKVILPGYMRAEVGTLSTEVSALQSATTELAYAGDSDNKDAPGAQGYLPDEMQRESLRRIADDLDGVKLDARIAALLDDQPAKATGTLAHMRQHKVKLVIHLR